MKRKKKFTLIIAPLAIVAFMLVSCSKEDDPQPDPSEQEKPASEILCTVDTIYLDYNNGTNARTVDLNTIFSIPEGTTGTITYRLRQPQFTETVENKPGADTPVNAYSLTGSTLSSIKDIRVPDTFVRQDSVKEAMTGEWTGAFTVWAGRNVMEGKVVASVRNGNNTIEKEAVIFQTGKPALVPTIKVKPSAITTGDVATVWVVDGGVTTFDNNMFTVEPIDFDINDVFVRAKEGSAYLKTETVYRNNASNSGGAGSGDYVMAVWCASKKISDRDAAWTAAVGNPTKPQAKLFVDSKPDEVVGIELRSESWREAQNSNYFFSIAGKNNMQAVNLIKLKWVSGREVPDNTSYDPNSGSSDKTQIRKAMVQIDPSCDAYLKGVASRKITDEFNGTGDWFEWFNLSATDKGKPVKITITTSNHAGEPAWTVVLTTTVKDPADLGN
jgi:hypothetical protein